jgi:hypothetical protein
MIQDLNSVPDAYLGVWRRRLLTTRDGLHDDTTDVYWLQTAHLHADLRIPQPRPAASAVSLNTCSQQQRLELTTQAGFAGLTEVHGDICQWYRLIDYQPSDGPADIGRMRFETADRIVEEGLDSSYHEVWERLPASVGTNDGLWLRAADGSARQGCLLVAGAYFLFAAERPIPLPPGGHLGAPVTAADNDRQCALLSFELSFGLIDPGWTITHSTLPGRIGKALLPSDSGAVSLSTMRDTDLARLGVFPPADGWMAVEVPRVPCLQEARHERT